MKSTSFNAGIREYGSTLYVGMALKKMAAYSYISIASDELKSLLKLWRQVLIHTYLLISSVYIWLTTFSRLPELIFKVENWQVANYYYSFPHKSFFCLLNYHNDSSTIPIAFIVKYLSACMENITAGYMKKESLNDCIDLISNWTPFL